MNCKKVNNYLLMFQMMTSPAHTGSVTPTMQPSPAMMHSPMSVPSGLPQQGISQQVIQPDYSYLLFFVAP